ncbi:uncharacterized protein E5676_scaffold606G001310 [Cucumis melo var. makuwa]|uniref:Retrovirus-related Pol polyprotein from transposon TNT 1-94 n=1 Tax=Cucumis melo var. makuwa TaxID=1194695 RepID=A0A5A7UYE7_CUCMM|nr:uncharacterized protein E6C27_scaffold132G001040 [Cucumis melo var. makuwa]TYK07235.1 uncharacterized protein E5676_scaffold606G001310 [Cucumis melo var. makuwa]
MKAKRVQLQGLRTEFETLRMKTSESVIDFFAKTMTIANKMQIHGEKMEDVAIMEKILRSMSSKFNFVVCFIEESKILIIFQLMSCRALCWFMSKKLPSKKKRSKY